MTTRILPNLYYDSKKLKFFTLFQGQIKDKKYFDNIENALTYRNESKPNKKYILPDTYNPDDYLITKFKRNQPKRNPSDKYECTTCNLTLSISSKIRHEKSLRHKKNKINNIE